MDEQARFRQTIESFISHALNVEFLLDEIRYGLLRNTVEHCFREKGYKISRQKKAEIILSVLFSRLVRDFRFEDFLTLIPKKEQKIFLTDLLYHIYYINLTLEHLASSQHLFFYLFRQLAMKASEKTIQAIFSSLSYSEKLKCLGFCVRYFDEGAMRIMQIAKGAAATEIAEFLSLLERSLIDKQEFADWTQSQDSFSQDELNQVLKAIYKQIDQKVEKVTQKLQEAIYQGIVKAPCKKVTFDEVKRTLLVFGLYDHQVPREARFLHEFRALDVKLEKAIDAPQSPGAATFIESIIEQVYTFNHALRRYEAGLRLITFAMPTAGKALELLFWLPSLVQAIMELGSKQRVPIFIFDQSESKLFKKNRSFIHKLQRSSRKIDIFHLDTSQILLIANKIGCTDMLVCEAGGRFGYGGSRNAVFFIAPLLKYYYDKVGAKTLIEHVHSLDASELQQDFREVVLQEKKGSAIIHMGDDDIYLPLSTVFSDALFAYQHSGEYFTRAGWIIGRRTIWTETSFDLEYVLNRYSDILLQHKWDDAPFFHGMAALLTKPKLCLNLPYGHEESYLQAMHYYQFDFRLPSMHLSGYRFPKQELPQNRFTGLAELLLQHYRYLFGLLFIMDVVDPGNALMRCALPWNEHEPFKNLSDAISCMLQSSTKKEMQRRFFENLAKLSEAYRHYKIEEHDQKEFSTLNLCVLESQNIAKALQGFKKEFKKEMKEFRLLFEKLAQDAAILKELAETKVAKAEGIALTPVLVDLLRVVGDASFQDALAKLST